MEPQRQEVAEEEEKAAKEEEKAAKEEEEAAKEEAEAAKEEAIGEEIAVSPKDLKRGPWMDPTTTEYGRGKRYHAAYIEVVALAHSILELETTESALMVIAEDEPENYKEAMKSAEEAK